MAFKGSVFSSWVHFFRFGRAPLSTATADAFFLSRRSRSISPRPISPAPTNKPNMPLEAGFAPVGSGRNCLNSSMRSGDPLKRQTPDEIPRVQCVGQHHQFLGGTNANLLVGLLLL